MLRRKQGQTQAEEGGAQERPRCPPASTGTGGPVGSQAARGTTNAAASQRTTGISSSAASLAPLAGGTSMFRSRTPSRAASGLAGPSADGAQGLSNLVGRAKTMLGGFAQGQLPRTKKDAQGKGASQAKGTNWLPMGVAALVVVTILGTSLFYREHAAYVDGQVHMELPDTDSNIETKSFEAPVESKGASAPVASNEEALLRAEIASLKQDVGRHEQMLRYIMDRYAEKGVDTKTMLGLNTSVAADAHDIGAAVMSVNYSQPESVSKSYSDGDADFASRVGPVGALRKKGSGGGDAVGMASMER